MKIRGKNEKGFTLVEVIVTLVLVGITAALAGMWIVSVVNGYIFTKMNADTVQKAQLAMTRITKELSALKSVTSAGTDNISFSRIGEINISTGVVTETAVTISRSGSQLLINGSPLTDSVNAFTLTYCDDNFVTPGCSGSWTTDKRIIEVTLALTGADNTTSTFTKRVMPRNI
jgi:prepilin-type N-terminal cleavage/methylation domain-containing protein